MTETARPRKKKIDPATGLRRQLSLRLALMVFASIAIIATAVLIPGWLSHKADVVTALQRASLAEMHTGFAKTPGDLPAIADLPDGTAVVGYAVYGKHGNLIKTVGEAPEELTWDLVLFGEGFANAAGSRIETAWPMETTGLPISVIARIDDSMVTEALIGFLIRTGGLIFAVAFCVVAITMVIFDRLVLQPVFQIKEKLKQATLYPESGKYFKVEHDRQDEVGDLLNAYNTMVMRMTDYVGEIKAAKSATQAMNQELEQKVEQRTEEIESKNQQLRREMQERQEAEAKLLHAAYHDPLTGLPNREAFTRHVQNAIDSMKDTGDDHWAVVLFNLDRFRLINETLGADGGNDVLEKVGLRLKMAARGGDMVARFGSDDFAIHIRNIDSLETAKRAAARIQKSLEQPIEVDGREVFCSASVGLAIANRRYEMGESLLQDAGVAVGRAKARGRGRFEIFQRQMRIDGGHMLKLEGELRQALSFRGDVEDHPLRLHYQPIIELQTGQIKGFEALMRWYHAERGMISPTEFIPLAEETGLIAEVGDLAMQQAVRDVHHWRQTMPGGENLYVTVNVSAPQLAEKDFIDKLNNLLSEANLPSQAIKLEVTESVVMEEPDQALRVFDKLRGSGIELAIDDFGTGYSSLSHLRQFPFTHLKVDRCFIKEIDTDRESFEIVRTIADLAATMDMVLVAEGVENEQVAWKLKQLNCKLAQGYHFSRPLSAEDCEELMRERPNFGMSAA
ncbi:MAG: hypothetical protein Alpg2KO_16460 [Alphaproteobacteria bacterium]